MKRTVRFRCAHEGCEEYAHYEADNREDSIRLQTTYGNGKWLCTRHSRPNEVLSAENTETVHTMKVFQKDYGRFWGVDQAISGFTYGPGFKAFAKDFPEGTVIEVTARIILPTHTIG